MSDSFTQQFLQLVRRIGNQLNRKVAEVLLVLTKYKNKSKETSRFFRSEECFLFSYSSRVSYSTELDRIDELHPPLKLTLGELVRKKLHGSRKITCQLLGVILEEETPEELKEHATVRSSVVEVLWEISKTCDVYLMDRIIDDESGERVLLALENAGLFEAGCLTRDKVLFCSTENGRMSFIQQLEPDWHVDSNREIVSQLSRFIRYQLYVSPTGSPITGSNIFSSTSLDSYLTE
ncbi:peroxisome biogenesis protein 22-like [Papaver somniferum]|uniref:peroxisome biogenesis protein 22-like n=1 Tax=Papaver somniferum TaxID=3469 RepID=UPI000E6F83BA|nr:peroxisome biogenesis protein 22-like [Papaver somniferum]